MDEQKIKQHLPFLAQVAGGEAGVFNTSGEILYYVTDGRVTLQDGAGAHVSRTDLSEKALQTGEPMIGVNPSDTEIMAAYIPLTPERGIYFGNETIIRRLKLAPDNRRMARAKYTINDIIGDGPRMTYAKSLCPIGAKASSVLLTGETGTGKELFAQAIHNLSVRRDRPFIAVNCGALPASIIESYLFGYAPGSFTGAKKGGSPGIFEQANHGTVLLDEISEMPFELQVKLLRVLQEKEVTRVGESIPIPLDIKIIATTNRELLEEIAARRFREDLYYRINSLEIHIPALREHKEDIPQLTAYFIREFNLQQGKNIRGTSPVFMDQVIRYNWKGNIRELRGCIERAMNMADYTTDFLDESHLPRFLMTTHVEDPPVTLKTDDLKVQALLAEVACIRRVLSECGGSKKLAAARMNITPTTMWRKLKEYEDMVSSLP